MALSQLANAVLPVTGVVTCSPSATALALDGYPDNKLFFRTVPSDSLEMVAIERRVERTGVETVAVGYLDDPYGRGLKDAFAEEVAERNEVTLHTPIGFNADQEDLSGIAEQLLADGGPGVIVVLGDADDGTRLLQAIDVATSGITPPEVVVNDAIRDGRQAIQALTAEFRARLSGVAPVATTMVDGGPEGFFTANAMDCVNLIALAAIQAGSDDPGEIKKNMASVSAGGQVCADFADCAERLAGGFSVDYSGYSGDVELSTTTGERTRAWFEAFGFDAEGVDQRLDRAVRGPPRFLGRLDEILDVVEVADEEASELAVERAAAVEPQRVHDVLDDVEVVGEQRDAPLEVVEPGRGGDQLQHAARRTSARSNRAPSSCRGAARTASRTSWRAPRGACSSGRSRTPACPPAAAAGTAGRAACARGAPWRTR